VQAPATRPQAPSAPATTAYNGRERFLAACRSQPLDRPPLWLMRQAGRALPEYRALKQSHSFLELVQTPDLATEVTLQPIRRFRFDAAVIFSDILIAAEALGQSYRFREEGGIAMDFALETPADLDRLQPDQVRDRLQYLGTAIRQVRRELGQETAVLGFAGSPWTLANFMFEGGSTHQFRRAKQVFYTDPHLFERFMDRITRAVIHVLQLQIEAGADAVQIFDTLAELLAASSYEAASGRWIRRIIRALPPHVPTILYVRGAPHAIPSLLDAGLRGFSVDWRAHLPQLRRELPQEIVLQGNLDPALMTSTPTAVTAQTRLLLESMRHARGYIFNLGHGLPPDATLANLEALATTVQQFQ
jgi:uroporphyrinogen decarboxylase